MNDSVKSTIVLTAICLIVTLILSAVNYVTAPIIKQNADKAVQESLKAVLPSAASFEEVELKENTPETVKAVYKDTAGSGFAIALETTSSYSEAPMAITVGISADGIIQNIVITNYSETKDFGADYPNTYVGKDASLAGVDLVSGVTYSSTAFKNAINDAFTAMLGGKSDAVLVNEAMGELLPGTVNNTGSCDAKLDETSGLYVSSNKAGYAMVADKVVYVADAFGSYVGFKSEEDAPEDASVVEALKTAAAQAYAAENTKHIERIQKIYEGAEVTPLTVNVQSTVNGAYSFTADGTAYYAFTASPFGYGGVMNLLYIVNENGEIAKFKVLSHNETEYYGEVVAQSEYAGRFSGAVLGAVGDDITTIAGCTFTSTGVKTAVADVTAAFNAVKEAQ